jgi:hypothetical protein
MTRPIRHAPRRESTAADAVLRDAPERDQCGFCGGFYTPGPDGPYGVCPADGGRAYNGLADSAGPLD